MIHLTARLILIAAFGAGLVCFFRIIDALAPWGWILLVLCVFLRLVRRPPRRLWACGTARWAEVDGDLRPAGMIVKEH